MEGLLETEAEAAALGAGHLLFMDQQSQVRWPRVGVGSLSSEFLHLSLNHNQKKTYTSFSNQPKPAPQPKLISIVIGKEVL